MSRATNGGMMSKKALSDFVRFAKYAVYNPAAGRRETWKEQVARMFNMHRIRYAYEISQSQELADSIDRAEKMVLDKKILGSQRALQYGGKPILQKNARLYNCSATYADRYRFFQELVYLTMCGCGVGFSVQYRHANMMPPIRKRNGEKIRFVIPDTMEGWADAAGVLISSYAADAEKAPFPAFVGRKVEFDYSLIRPEGSKISSGGKCPGHLPLKGCLDKCDKALSTMTDGLDDSERYKMKPIEIYDLAMHMAGAVVAGGVRRSATICIFSLEDDEMIKAKTGNWFEGHPHWQNSNNSVALIRGKVSKEKYEEVFKSTREFGEPGFIWMDNEDVLFNPCSEIGLVGYTDNGNMNNGMVWDGDDYATGKIESGVEFCNLSEINCGKIKTEQDFYDAAAAAAIIGTLQAGYTEIGYLTKVTKEIIEKESLIGVSLTGIMENPDICLNPEIQQKGAGIVVETNKLIASLIGINQAARCTCVKPSGTASSLLETSPGIHPHHSHRYLRRVRANRNEKALQFYEENNPSAIEPDFTDMSKMNKVITFACENSKKSRTKADMSAMEFLRAVLLTQKNWIEYGTNPELSIHKGLRHNVSNTIHIKDDSEWEAAKEFLYDNRDSFAGVSFLPMSGDKSYNQAPYANVMGHEELVAKFGPGAFMASGLIVLAMEAWDGDLWSACDTLLGLKSVKYGIGNDDNPEFYHITGNRLTWIKKAKNFSEKYFNGNISDMILCLKEVQCLYIWEKIVRNHKDVHWEECIETIDGTKIQQDVACAGGACEITSI